MENNLPLTDGNIWHGLDEARKKVDGRNIGEVIGNIEDVYGEEEGNCLSTSVPESSDLNTIYTGESEE